MKIAVIVRGPSGCGKSTYTKCLEATYRATEGCNVSYCSADNFFTKTVPLFRTDGIPSQQTRLEYVFDPTKLAEAHSDCFQRFVQAVKCKSENRVVIVDNTFIHKWEMINYVEVARLAGYTVQVHEFRVETIEELRMCIRRNVHRVPVEVVAKMALEFEPWDGGCVVVPIEKNKKDG